MSNLTYSSAKAPQLYSLTSLRFFAALCIVVLHAANHGLLSLEFLHGYDLSKAVAFFFVLSGFVLGYAYDRRTINAWKFYQARLARIWPATVLSILFVLLILPRFIYLPPLSSPWSSGLVFALNVLCLQAFIPIPAVFFGFNAVAWSISVELFFYFCFPVVHSLKTRRLFKVSILAVLLALLFAFVITKAAFPAFSRESLDSPVWQGFIYINPLARLPEFLIGVLTARFFLSESFCKLKNFFFIMKKKFRLLLDLLEFLVLIAAFWLGFHSHAIPLPMPLWLPLQVAVYQILSALCFCVLILTSANSSGLLGQLLKWKPLLLLGEVSFGLYLFHQPIMIRSAQLGGLSKWDIQFLPPEFFPVLAWSLGVSFVSFFFFERPLQKFLRPTRS